MSTTESTPSNKSEINWMITRLNSYLTPEDEPLIEELNKVLEYTNIEDIDISQYNERVNDTIEICNVLDRFPMKKIEGYLRKKKIDNLNRLNNPQDEMMDSSVSSV